MKRIILAAIILWTTVSNAFSGENGIYLTLDEYLKLIQTDPQAAYMYNLGYVNIAISSGTLKAECLPQYDEIPDETMYAYEVFNDMKKKGAFQQVGAKKDVGYLFVALMFMKRCYNG